MALASESERIPCWIDCDPGHDDAFALILCLHSARLRLLGVSSVHGNASLQRTTVNARRVLQAAVAPANVRVFEGAARPLLRGQRHDPDIHGSSGLDGTCLLPQLADDHQQQQQQQHVPVQQKAVLAMAQAILTCESKVWLVATGPLTNVALLLSLFPEVEERLEGISIMGGAWERGNRSPVAEFNILCDPEAASIVLQRGEHINIVMVTIDVTHTVLVTKEVMARIQQLHSTFGTMAMELLQYFTSSYQSEFGFECGPPLHDPCAVAYLIAPEIFSVKRIRVDVDYKSELCSGQTVFDFFGQTGRACNCTLVTEIDVDAFWDIFMEALRRCDIVSPLNKDEDEDEHR